ncbi:MAG: glycosyltransferase family 2 protein [Candidatus Roizmanbacteria bacterium]|nr:glycosyltransferase family 2 protein [Candidatus Roizmanbacteria bacterium]
MAKDMLSVVYIVKNGGKLFSQSLAAVQTYANEIIVVDNGSTDTSALIARRAGAHVYKHNSSSESVLRTYALSKAHSDWILFLDHDEIVSTALGNELIKLILANTSKNAYVIPYRNHLFGKELNYAGETYSMLRFFKKKSVYVTEKRVHATFQSNKTLGITKNKLDHYSYNSLLQILIKFTNYAKRDAREKYNKHETVTLRKLLMHGPHLFWVRFIKEYGYKDGLQRIMLDLCFAYMECATYAFLYYLYIRKKYAQK